MQGVRHAPITPAATARGAVLAALGGWALEGVGGSPEPLLAGCLILAALGVVALGSRYPLVSLVGSFAALFASAPLALSEDAFLALLVWSCYLVGRHAELKRQPWAAGGVLLFLSLNLTETSRDPTAADAIFPVLLSAGPWLLGLSVQLAQHREQLAVAQAEHVTERWSEDVQRATAEERLRIAQELHDVVAHGISAVSLQAQVTRRAVESGGKAELEQLRTIERTAQQVMTDIRQLLGVLRVEDATTSTSPVASMVDVDGLLEECRRLGQRLEVREHGQPRRLPPAMSAAAYRILQESLTNARRHGSGGITRVQLGWEVHSVTFEVRNPVAGPAQAAPGHGVTGMVERARLFGGDTTISVEASEWVVAVRIPVPALEPELHP